MKLICYKNNNQLLSLLNASHRKRGAYKIISESNSKGNWTPKQWSLWTPQVIADWSAGRYSDEPFNLCKSQKEDAKRNCCERGLDYFELLEDLRIHVANWTAQINLTDHTWEIPSQGSDRAKDN